MKNIISLLLISLFTYSCQAPKEEIQEPESELGEVKELSPAVNFFGEDYYIDASHSYVGFKIKYFGYSPVRGRFDDFFATAFYNEENINDLSVSLSISSLSINTANEMRDNDLSSEATWFDAPNFPNIEFKSSEIIPKSEGRFDLIGEITLKGITKVDTFHFDRPTTITHDWAMNDQVDFSGRATINRQDFEVFGGDFWSSVMENGLTQLSDEVEIEVDIHCRKANYQERYNTLDSTDIRKEILDLIRDNGLEEGLRRIKDLNEKEELSSGKLSSVANTLNAWKMHQEALTIFETKLEYYPDKIYTWDQIGVCNLYMGNLEEAKVNFNKTLKLDPNDPKAKEYLRLIDRMN